jgi:mono/diheme cytochrome c family protein
MKKIISSLSLAMLMFFGINTAASSAGVAICGPSGEILFKRHCSACHRDAAKLKAVKNITDIIRNPPDVMPGFDKNKISDLGVKEIADYIYQGSDFRVGSKKR